MFEDKIQATVHVYYSIYVLQLKKNELTSNRPSTKEYGDRMVTMGTISVKHTVTHHSLGSVLRLVERKKEQN